MSVECRTEREGILYEDKRYRHHGQRDESDQCRRPLWIQFVVHLCREQRKRGSSKTTQYGGRSKSRRSDKGVRVNDVVEKTQLSIQKLISGLLSSHANKWLTNIQQRDQPNINEDIIGAANDIVGNDVHANQKKEIAKKGLAIMASSKRNSGGTGSGAHFSMARS